MQQKARAVPNVDVNVPEGRIERRVRRDGRIDDLVGVPVPPDDASLPREDTCTDKMSVSVRYEGKR